MWRRPPEKRVCWACAFGILSRSCPAALRPFLSSPPPPPPPGEEGGFQPGSLRSLSPQGFVLAVTIIREAVEEIRCYLRDKEVNSQVYSRLTVRGQPGLRWGCLLQLNHRPLTVREQSSRPGAGGGVGAAWQDSHSVAGTREANLSPGAQGVWAASPGGQALLEPVLWANLCVISWN